jgi:hypothetical protein
MFFLEFLNPPDQEFTLYDPADTGKRSALVVTDHELESKHRTRTALKMTDGLGRTD